MILNPDQQTASDAILQFLLSDRKEFVLEGPAGTGKTFLMDHVKHNILQDYRNLCKLFGKTPIAYSVEMTATTNKAAEVLSNSVRTPCPTIHSFLGLRVIDDYQTGETRIVKTRQESQKSYNRLLFIDEASMVNADLYAAINEGTDDKTCKIIYVGDRRQLAPVSEKLSKAFAARDANSIASMTTLVRNAGQPALMDLCNRLRDAVDTETFFSLPVVPGVIDHVTGPQAEAWIDQTFATQTQDHKILAFTNARVQQYHSHIRGLRKVPELFVPGEIVVANSAFTLGSDVLLKVEQQITLHKVDAQTSFEQIDMRDPSVLLEYYTVEFGPGSHIIGSAKIPYDYNHYKALLSYYGKKKNWEVYFALKNGFADLRQIDACTVYKAQGSTYDTVLIDLEDIGTCYDPGQVARMLYVAASRARNRIILFGELPYRYGGAPGR